MSYANTSFSYRLQILLEEKGINQKKLSEMTGIAAKTISKWKKPGNDPSEGSIIKIAQATGCTFDWLMRGDLPMFSPVKEEFKKPQEITFDHEKESFKISEMAKMAIEILESDTIYKSALASNIRAFYQSVQNEKEMDEMKRRMLELEERLKKLEGKMTNINTERHGEEPPEKREEANG